MARTIYYGLYPSECARKTILPYLENEPQGNMYDCEYNGKYLTKEFFDACRSYAVEENDPECYVFNDTEKLFGFLGNPNVPDKISDFVNVYFSSDTPVLIIWLK